MTRAHAKLVVKAHLEHPSRDGRTLCGDESQKVRACPECFTRWVSARLVHVDNPRKSGRSLCGQSLYAPPDVDGNADGYTVDDYTDAYVRKVVVGADGKRPALAYVPAAVARDVLGYDSPPYPVCPGCASNLGRLDEAEQTRLAFGSVASSTEDAVATEDEDPSMG